ncbi:CC171 protein, partial [Origma solitaria]|nr:CC171 protein [Origma solitaria]
LEGLSGTEFCALLHENVQGLIINFHKANEKIAYLEHICKQKTDTMRDLQQSHDEAYRKVTEQLATQEHCWQKEKKFLEMQYSNLLEEAQARAKECEDTAQKNRQKMSGLEKSYERLTQENINTKNTLANIQKERSSLLAACALLAGALFPLYIRLCAISSQRDLLQDLVNHHELVNQKVGTIVRALPANVESNPDGARQRQRRAKGLVFVFRRDVIAVLTVNRLKILARSSCSLFVWSKGLRGSLGIQVCVGESRGRRNVSRFEEQGVDCVEALDWLTSSNLHAAIISSISELQDVLN